ncbi:hypothetical protein HDU97_010388 [Phlyctochytrium planicorne]|nr:hypothetical protein HDU97_010388 [Phlyctochytrium planicorne]
MAEESKAFDHPEPYALKLFEFIQSHYQLLSFQASRFIVEDQWNSVVPEEWHALEYESLDTISAIANCGSIKATWPDSLKRFISSCKDLKINSFSEYKSLEGLMPNAVNQSDEEIWLDYSRIPEKRKEEVTRFSQITGRVAEMVGAKSVLELGSGDGHVAIALSSLFGLNVVAVDKDTEALQKGISIHQRLQEQDCGHGGKIAFKEIKLSSSSDSSGFQESIQALEASIYQSNNRSIKKTNTPWIICGLQTCGELSSYTFRTYLDSSAVAMVNVGCCYHMLSPDMQDAGEPAGFPISNALRTMGFRLSLNALSTASQLKHPKHSSTEDIRLTFKKSLYRSILSCIINENSIKSSDRELNPNVLRSEEGEVAIDRMDISTISVVEYTRKALSYLHMDPQRVSDSTILQAFMWNEDSFSSRIALAWTLRWILADVIEALILIDRWMFLNEGLAGKGAKDGEVFMGPFVQNRECARTCMFICIKSKY